MRFLLFLALTVLLTFRVGAQGTKIEITTCKELGNEGLANLFEVGFKVVSGKIEGTGRPSPLALPLPNGTKAFAYITPYDDVAAGKTAPSPVLLKVYGQKIQTGKTLVSHDLAVIKTPSNRTFAFQSQTAFLGDESNVFSGNISGIKGLAVVGDEFAYTNDRGQQGKGKILAFEVEGGYNPDIIFEGIPDNLIWIKVLTSGKVDFSDSKVVPANAAGEPVTPIVSTTSKAPLHKARTIPLGIILENKDVKITVHNLVRFNPDSTDRSLDILKVDYTLNYYIVDATFENKTSQQLDIGEYILRFNFFSRDGKSADDFLRIFRNKNSPNDQVKKDADKIDTNIFGGTSKIAMAGVMVKYETTIPNYDSEHRAQTNALNKGLARGQKIRSINASIMGVSPDYKIEGLGTWNGTFWDKKNLLFAPVTIK